MRFANLAAELIFAWAISLNASFAIAEVAPVAAGAGTKAQASISSPPLDLSAYTLTFEDNFDKLDIVKDKETGGAWYAPIHTPFGATKFLPPDARSVFEVKNGVLSLFASKVGDAWEGGLFQSVDSTGRGFAQQYGYFEMRAKFPRGPATWPAFWLLTQKSLTDKSFIHGEIDVVESYGDQPNVVHMGLHVRQRGVPRWSFGKQSRVSDMYDEFHRYGVLIDPTWMVFYFDGMEIYRFPTLEQYKTPMYLLVDLAMADNDALQRANPRNEMQIDYVRAYARKPD